MGLFSIFCLAIGPNLISSCSAAASQTPFRPGQLERTTMTGGQGKDEGKPGEHVKDSRRDRLKLALRENLKRRKAQARGRDAGPSENADASLDDAGGEKPTA
jgi:hypothetical protein